VRIASRRELADLFLRDRAAHVYALADLDDPVWSASTWWIRDQAAVGLVGLPGPDGSGPGPTVVYAVSTADAPGSLALAGELAAGRLSRPLPDTLVTGPIGIAAVLAAAGRSIVWQRTYHRYHLADPTAVPAVADLASDPVVPLGPENSDELARLYATEPGAAFFLSQMSGDQTFVGVRRAGELVAAAGTHVLSDTYSVAAIGAVFTHPEHRRVGLGAAVTAGVIARLQQRRRPIEVIGLNCADRNESAKRIYLAMGFRPTLGYEECEVGPSVP
jgi:GNAT superfamily N-acetyltransferase